MSLTFKDRTLNPLMLLVESLFSINLWLNGNDYKSQVQYLPMLSNRNLYCYPEYLAQID